MQPKVTWLLPVRNGMPYLSQTLESIAAQTRKDFTVLAWDDGSTDDTLSELKRWIPASLPGKVITGRAVGLGACLAEMVKAAETEYCARIDADDVNMPHRLEREVAYLDAHPEVVAVGSQVEQLDRQGGLHGQFHEVPLGHDDILHLMMVRWVMWHPTVLFRRKSVLAAGNYRNFSPVLIEDYDLWLRLARVGRLANLQECLLHYRVTESNATITAQKKGLLEGALRQCFIDNAEKTYGLSAAAAALLCECKHRCAIIPLLRVAKFLSLQHEGSVVGRLQSQSFREAAKRLAADKDTLTLLVLALTAPTLREKWKGLCSSGLGVRLRSFGRYPQGMELPSH